MVPSNTFDCAGNAQFCFPTRLSQQQRSPSHPWSSAESVCHARGRENHATTRNTKLLTLARWEEPGWAEREPGEVLHGLQHWEMEAEVLGGTGPGEPPTEGLERGWQEQVLGQIKVWLGDCSM